MKRKVRSLNIAHLVPLCMAQPVIFFDGVCNLCNAAVQFIIKHDKAAVFKLAALQSAAATRLLVNLPENEAAADSILLLENGKVYTRSTAALRIAKRLTGRWKLLYVLILVPRFIRDAVYKLVARNRYRIWGKQDNCMVPAPDLQERFLS
jgi:predicted DCC family thiol-disulfide oxidoreductase YuxK